MNEPTLLLDHVETPIGRLALIADEDAKLRAVGWTDGHPRMERLHASLRPTSNPGGLTAALRDYFAGDLTVLDSLPAAFAVGSHFQRTVWHSLRQIPCGETRSYRDIARLIGKPAASRAVGRAAGANPIAVVVPCHRVVGSDGSLTGYGAGIERKRWLLAHERGGHAAVQIVLC
jgi:methylated-DNA-[protein]-cysteine S-methyltransferase